MERTITPDSNMSNIEQINNILRPALVNFFSYVTQKNFLLKAVIPNIVNANTVLKPGRITKILEQVNEGKLIEEFIQGLEVLKLGPNSTSTIPKLPLPAPLPAPTSTSSSSSTSTSRSTSI